MNKRLAILTAATLVALALLAAPAADAVIAIIIDNPFIGDPDIKTCPTLSNPNEKRPALFQLVEIASIGDPGLREAAVAADRNIDGFACRFFPPGQ